VIFAEFLRYFGSHWAIPVRCSVRAVACCTFCERVDARVSTPAYLGRAFVFVLGGVLHKRHTQGSH
jgi:hypothetical protein